MVLRFGFNVDLRWVVKTFLLAKRVRRAESVIFNKKDIRKGFISIILQFCSNI